MEFTVIVGAVFVFFYEWHHRGDIHGLRSGRSAYVAGSASALLGVGNTAAASSLHSSALFSDGTPRTLGWIIALFTAASAPDGTDRSDKEINVVIDARRHFRPEIPPSPVTQGGMLYLGSPKKYREAA